MSTQEILGLIIFAVIFLTGFIPMAIGIIQLTRENRRLDREWRESTKKGAAHHIV
jgi:hypothetical protein